MREAVVAYIALGSNLGDRERLILEAARMLGEHEQIEVTRLSDLIETEPVGPGHQPDYLNAAAALCTRLSARELLDEMLAVERRLGRDRGQEQRWGPRTIDLDLLLYGDHVIRSPDLTVPHPHMHERLFVLEPLCRIAAGVAHPVLGKTVGELMERCRTSVADD